MQKEFEPFFYKINFFYAVKNIKSPLTDLFLIYLKKNKLISEGQRLLFLDDKPHCLEAFEKVCKEHKILCNTLQITDNPYRQNYLEFFKKYYPLVQYQEFILKSYAKFELLINELWVVLPKFLFFQVTHRELIIPAKIILQVLTKIKKDMEKDIAKHDCISGTRAFIHELTKQCQTIAEMKHLPEKESSISKYLKDILQDDIFKINEIYIKLSDFYNVSFNVIGKAPTIKSP